MSETKESHGTANAVKKVPTTEQIANCRVSAKHGSDVRKASDVRAQKEKAEACQDLEKSMKDLFGEASVYKAGESLNVKDVVQAIQSGKGMEFVSLYKAVGKKLQIQDTDITGVTVNEKNGLRVTLKNQRTIELNHKGDVISDQVSNDRRNQLITSLNHSQNELWRADNWIQERSSTLNAEINQFRSYLSTEKIALTVNPDNSMTLTRVDVNLTVMHIPSYVTQLRRPDFVGPSWKNLQQLEGKLMEFSQKMMPAIEWYTKTLQYRNQMAENIQNITRELQKQ